MTDWLIHYLKRIPPHEALLRAIEQTFLQAALPDPMLDLRDHLPFAEGEPLAPPSLPDSTEAQSAVFVATQRPWQSDLNAYLSQILRLMPIGGKIAVALPSETDSAESWATHFAQHGYQINQWRPYFSQATAEQYEQEQKTYSNSWLHELSGRYAWPWVSEWEPRAVRLRPYYSAELQQAEGKYRFFLVEKRSQEPLEPHLPPPSLLRGEQPRDEAERVVLPTYSFSSLQESPSKSRPTPQTRPPLPIRPLLGLLTLIAGWILLGVWQNGAWRETALWASITAGGLFLLQQFASKEGVGFSLKQPSSADFSRLTLLGGAFLLSWVSYAMRNTLWLALGVWLVAIGLAFFAVEGWHSWREWVRNRTFSIGRSLPLLVLTLFALVLRLWQLNAHPSILNGIETQLGLDAQNPFPLFGQGWLTNPTFPLLFLRATLALFGPTVWGVRLTSVLVGTATVTIAYFIGRTLWNERVGFLSALLLATSPLHLHYSRLGMTNSWDALWSVTALGSFAVAWHTQQRRYWVLAGLTCGFSLLFYTPAHLFPFILIAILLWLLMVDWRTVRQQSGHFLIFGALVIIVALPQLILYQQESAVFWEREQTLNIVQTGWLTQQLNSQPTRWPETVTGHFNDALHAFHGTIDKDSSYNSGKPLVNRFLALFSLLGLILAVAHHRQPRYLVWCTLLSVTLLANSAIIEAIHSRRVLIALPAICFLAARSADWLATKALKPQYAHIALIIPILLFSFADLSFYFGRYRAENRFADRNSELVYMVGNYLQTRSADAKVYFYGPPALYASAPTIRFLAPQFQVDQNLFNVTDPASVPDDPQAIYIFIPETAFYQGELQAQFAQLSAETIQGTAPDRTITIVTPP